ncbi:hypothetical protein AAHA92_09711 [Salvia divinorum]|uniref:Secreted protein n=1 Tax=Salvia divinorum TaxID=28513 RepID=A0ABD1HSA3_SALDI
MLDGASGVLHGGVCCCLFQVILVQLFTKPVFYCHRFYCVLILVAKSIFEVFTTGCGAVYQWEAHRGFISSLWTIYDGSGGELLVMYSNYFIVKTCCVSL